MQEERNYEIKSAAWRDGRLARPFHRAHDKCPD